MSAKTDKFIQTIGTLAQNEYAGRSKAILPSVCIAQAALESGWNLEAKTLFGIKGKGFVATTCEYYNGNKVTIQDSFRSYPDVASAVVGYYEFLETTPRYVGALNNPNYRDAVNKLIHTTDGKPYATDPNYINKICTIIEQYGLTDWDVLEASMCVPEVEPAEKSIDDIAHEVYFGKWGNNPQRKQLLEAAGYNYDEVQDAVNRLLGVDSYEVITYTVQKGDTLSKLAKRFNTSVAKLALDNGIEDANKIYIGQKIKVS